MTIVMTIVRPGISLSLLLLTAMVIMTITIKATIKEIKMISIPMMIITSVIIFMISGIMAMSMGTMMKKTTRITILMVNNDNNQSRNFKT